MKKNLLTALVGVSCLLGAHAQDGREKKSMHLFFTNEPGTKHAFSSSIALNKGDTFKIYYNYQREQKGLIRKTLTSVGAGVLFYQASKSKIFSAKGAGSSKGKLLPAIGIGGGVALLQGIHLPKKQTLKYIIFNEDNTVQSEGETKLSAKGQTVVTGVASSKGNLRMVTNATQNASADAEIIAAPVTYKGLMATQMNLQSYGECQEDTSTVTPPDCPGCGDYEIPKDPPTDPQDPPNNPQPDPCEINPYTCNCDPYYCETNPCDYNPFTCECDPAFCEENGGGSTTTPPGNPPKTPKAGCPENSIYHGDAVTNNYNQAGYSASFLDLQSGIGAYQYERSFSMGLLRVPQAGGTDTYVHSTTPISTGTTNGSTMYYEYDKMDIIASAHTHPTSGFQGPSATDLYVTLKGAGYSDYQTTFVLSAGGVNYALQITNRAAAQAFLAAYPENGAVDHTAGSPTQNAFIPGTPLYNIFNQAYNNIYSMGQSSNDAYAQALAFVLDSQNTGITLLKQDSAGYFGEMHTTQVTDAVGNVVYPTVNCN